MDVLLIVDPHRANALCVACAFPENAGVKSERPAIARLPEVPSPGLEPGTPLHCEATRMRRSFDVEAASGLQSREFLLSG